MTFDRTTCVTLNLGWVVTPIAEEPVGLRLERANGELVVTAHEAAEARVRELEEELRR